MRSSGKRIIPYSLLEEANATLEKPLTAQELELFVQCSAQLRLHPPFQRHPSKAHGGPWSQDHNRCHKEYSYQQEVCLGRLEQRGMGYNGDHWEGGWILHPANLDRKRRWSDRSTQRIPASPTAKARYHCETEGVWPRRLRCPCHVLLRALYVASSSNKRKCSISRLWHHNYLPIQGFASASCGSQSLRFVSQPLVCWGQLPLRWLGSSWKWTKSSSASEERVKQHKSVNSA